MLSSVQCPQSAQNLKGKAEIVARARWHDIKPQDPIPRIPEPYMDFKSWSIHPLTFSHLPKHNARQNHGLAAYIKPISTLHVNIPYMHHSNIHIIKTQPPRNKSTVQQSRSTCSLQFPSFVQLPLPVANTILLWDPTEMAHFPLTHSTIREASKQAISFPHSTSQWSWWVTQHLENTSQCGWNWEWNCHLLTLMTFDISLRLIYISDLIGY